MLHSAPQRLRLYITGLTAHAADALRNVEILREHFLPEGCHIEVIDLAENPHIAENEKILATPMLVRTSPHPPRRIIGDLSDMEKVCAELHLPYASHIKE